MTTQVDLCEIGFLKGFPPCYEEATDTIDVGGELYNVCDRHKAVV